MLAVMLFRIPLYSSSPSTRPATATTMRTKCDASTTMRTPVVDGFLVICGRRNLS